MVVYVNVWCIIRNAKKQLTDQSIQSAHKGRIYLYIFFLQVWVYISHYEKYMFINSNEVFR